MNNNVDRSKEAARVWTREEKKGGGGRFRRGSDEPYDINPTQGISISH